MEREQYEIKDFLIEYVDEDGEIQSEYVRGIDKSHARAEIRKVHLSSSIHILSSKEQTPPKRFGE